MRQKVTWVWGITGLSPHCQHSSCMPISKPGCVWEAPSVGDRHTHTRVCLCVCVCVCVWDWPHTCACQTLRGADPALCLEITFVLIFTVTVNSQISFWGYHWCPRYSAQHGTLRTYLYYDHLLGGFPGGSSGKKKKPAYPYRRHKRHRFWSLGWEDPLEEGTAVLLPGDSYGQRSLVDYSLWGRKEPEMTELT